MTEPQPAPPAVRGGPPAGDGRAPVPAVGDAREPPAPIDSSVPSGRERPAPTKSPAGGGREPTTPTSSPAGGGREPTTPTKSPAGGGREPTTPTTSSAGGGRVPQRAEGVELIGPYEGSGFKETPFLARRGDGQVIQLTQLLYLVAEAVDGTRDHQAIAREVSERFGRKVSAGNVQFLVECKLRPLGVLAAADGSSPTLPKPDLLLGLRMRTALVPERGVQVLAAVFSRLFWPPVIVLALLGVAGFDVWLFFEHGLGGGLRAALYDPALLLLIFGGIVAGTAFHEIGHASACRYGGARPGVLGAGIYLVWPVFYCDVTDAYRLGKAGRLRTDLGGVYFNALFALACGGLYGLTRLEPLILLIVIQHLTILQQMLPLLRLDGTTSSPTSPACPTSCLGCGPSFAV